MRKLARQSQWSEFWRKWDMINERKDIFCITVIGKQHQIEEEKEICCTGSGGKKAAKTSFR